MLCIIRNPVESQDPITLLIFMIIDHTYTIPRERCILIIITFFSDQSKTLKIHSHVIISGTYIHVSIIGHLMLH